ncbi:YwiC-like family protein [Thermoactinomyces mirandus]|uniref:YwiC-like family protein n=1 Tax=Thermoactinomyces mirandus TaxID=2756294 RepID=A0A7W2ARP6_9BACL|nr:YwiC-like family protein [Thermoactinomyces mirandus]MBA4602843.1 YwiC-like family protein [Thermoactinomyces mirandus]
MKPILPREHGGWAMVSVPFFLGMAVEGPTWLHLPLFISWMLFYLAAYLFRLALMRRKGRRNYVRWSLSYCGLGIVFLLPPLIVRPSLLWAGPVLAGLLAVNGWYAYRRDERSFINDIVAILAFSVGGAASCLVGKGQLDDAALWVAVSCVLYFTGSVFFVKSVFRERKNANWQKASKGYHILLVVILAFREPLFVLPYAFSAVRTFVWGGKPLSPIKVGIIEIIGSVLFLILSILVFSVTRPSLI